MLASQGRIYGAVLKGKSWLIPENAAKPADERRKQSTSDPSEYFFPLVSYSVNSSYPVDRLSANEQAQYETYKLFESGNYEECYRKSKYFYNSSENRCLRLGSLYNLYYSCVVLHKYEEANRVKVLLLSMSTEFTEHREEIALIGQELEIFKENSRRISGGVSYNPLVEMSDGALAFISEYSTYSDLVSFKLGQKHINIPLHEINCINLERAGYDSVAMLSHFLLSVMYITVDNSEAEQYHLKKAFELAFKNNELTTVAMFISYIPDVAFRVLKEYFPDKKEKFTDLVEITSSAHTGYLEYCGNVTMLSKMTPSDYRFVSYCLHNDTIARISELEGLSESAVKHRLTALYKKIGVAGKKELTDSYSSTIYDFSSGCE